MDYRTTQGKFLSETQLFSCELPSALSDVAPTMATAVGYGSAGDYLGRMRGVAFGAFPTEGDRPENDKELRAVESSTVAGLDVAIYFRADPDTYLAFWDLGNDRFLSTFMPATLGDGENGADAIRRVVDCVNVASMDGMPAVSFSPPAEPGDVRNLRQRDETTYAVAGSEPDSWPVVLFRREPPWTLPQSASVNPVGMGDGWTQASLVDSNRIRIGCIGPVEEQAQLIEIVDRASESLRLL